MQQRQPRLGDILDDYCPRERRLTNHAVVAMVGPDVKQTRCTTCDAEHDYKHAKVPRQRKKSDSPAVLYAQVLAGGPKKVVHEAAAGGTTSDAEVRERLADQVDDPEDERHEDDGQLDLLVGDVLSAPEAPHLFGRSPEGHPPPPEEGPVHRRLIRAQLPRIEGQTPPARQAPDFTIRQPAGRVNRFRPRNQSRPGNSQTQGSGNRSHTGNGYGGNGHGHSGNGPTRSGSQGHSAQGQGGRPPLASRTGKHQGSGRKQPK